MISTSSTALAKCSCSRRRTSKTSVSHSQTCPAPWKGDLEAVVRVLAEKRWPWRLHATYDETIGRALDVFERVNRDIPLEGIHWFFDHAETVGERNLERIAQLGGGVAIQHRMAYQGEYFVERFGAKAAQRTPPFKRMLELGVPVGAGTDATRVASYDPWTSLHWLVTGETVGGTRLYPRENRLDRHKALELYTKANTWFSNEQGLKGQIAVGQLADFAVLSNDLFAVPDADIREIVSMLTVVDGRIVYGDGEFKSLDPDLPAPMPDWSPVNFGSRYWKEPERAAAMSAASLPCAVHRHQAVRQSPVGDNEAFWGALGCSCWAF